MPLDGSHFQGLRGASQASFPLCTDGWPKRPRRKRAKCAAPERSVQLAFHLSDAGCTPLMLRVEATLRRLASASDATPSYELLNTLAAGQNRSSVFRAVQKLAKLKRVVVQQEPERRRFVMLFDGRATEWSPFKPGHAPGRGAKKKRGKTPRSVKSSGLGQLPPPVVYTAQRADPEADTCQFALWADGERPTGKHCGAPTMRRSSWCADHHAAVYGRPRVAC